MEGCRFIYHCLDIGISIIGLEVYNKDGKYLGIISELCENFRHNNSLSIKVQDNDTSIYYVGSVYVKLN
jgi:ribosomal 30S subunit maturation factor RimM